MLFSSRKRVLFPRRKFFSLRNTVVISCIILSLAVAGYSYFSATFIDIPTTEEDTATTVAEAPPSGGSPETAQSPPPPPAPDTGTSAEAEIPEPATTVIKAVVKPGETFSGILQQWLGASEIHQASEVCAPVFSLNRLRAGRPYAVYCENDSFIRFEYEIDTEKKLILDREEGPFTAVLEDIVYDKVIERVQGTVKGNLFQAVNDAGEAAGIAVNLADIFAWEINFIRDIQPGDSFTLLVEKRFREGKFMSYGPIFGAQFVNKGVTYEGYRFRDAFGFPHYYTAEGKSVKRAFLKAPLSFRRISSTFTNSRLHPVLGVWRAHPGIDYAAPTGTPVKAIGSGTVTFSGWGKGAGNYIAIKHMNGYESMYLHLSAFAKGLAKGNKVRQGEIIGYVGSTGYSTGPHLDFRMKKDGAYINPIQLASPRTEPVSKKDVANYTKRVAEIREYLSGAKDPVVDPPKSEI